MLDKKSQRLNNLRGTCNEFDAKKSTDADGKRERETRGSKDTERLMQL